MEAPIHIALVEDDEEIRANLAYRIGESVSFRLVGSYRDGETAMTELPKRKANVVLMDINLPGINGVECVRLLKPKMAETQFIMLTVYEDSNRLFKSLVAGASGYLLKRTTPSKLMAAIREAHRGGSPMTPQIARLVVQHFRQTPTASPEIEALTARERDVLDQLSKGFRYKEIVDNLAISEGTLHSHIRNIYDKLHVHSRTEAVVKYLNC
ncbi:MAG TPA: response regulator transcription factor [Verrucomicrobiae bacterium]|jgi:DNA-binding NarL/FixJ family response regulator|nr:response regulator transcription factor [Verrucomicrobiae bacterium]